MKCRQYRQWICESEWNLVSHIVIIPKSLTVVITQPLFFHIFENEDSPRGDVGMITSVFGKNFLKSHE